MKADRLSVKTILSYITDERLDFFAQATCVDWNVKKLTGKELFKLCLFCAPNFAKNGHTQLAHPQAVANGYATSKGTRQY